MLTKSLASIILLCALGSIASGYSLDGYWDMTPTGVGQYQTIKQMVTFQFKREVDSGGKIVSYLYVYNCFLAKFLYQISEREIWFNFKTSSILSQNCSIAQISEIRNLLQRVFVYSIRYDQLSLLDPRGTAVFSMVRQKIDYKNVLVGIWDLFTNQERASTLTYINGTDIYMCRDLSTFSYNLTTINGSYPQLTVRKGISGACNDSSFVNGISKSAFFQVAENRSQLLIFDRIGQYILTMNQQGSIKPNLKLASDPSPPQSKTLITQNNSKSNSYNSASAQSSNSQNKLVNVNSQTSQSTQSSPIQSTSRYQPPQQVKAPPAQPAAQTTAQVSQPIIPIQYTLPIQPSPAPSTQPTQSTQSSQPVQSSQLPQPSINYQDITFPQTLQPIPFSYQFGSNSFTSPAQVVSEPVYINPVPIKATQVSYAQSIIKSDQTPTNPPSISSQQQPVQNDDFAGEFSFVSQDQSFNADSFSNQGQPELSASASTYSNSQIIQSSQNNITPEISLQDFIQQSKWLIYWLNGLNVVPNHLNRVYIVFTSIKIILYCPCNTYYTGYQLQGNYLKGLQWMGTQNQCDNNRDSELTNYIFYSNKIKANGNNLVFYFSTQAKAAEFQPYF